MRVSSSAPAMSRRSILRGLGLALVGASVPAAAFVGRELARPGDAELVTRCQLWKEQSRKIKRMEKRLQVYAANAKSLTPAKPRELFEPVSLDEATGFIRYPDDGGCGPSGHAPLDGSWARDRLELWTNDRLLSAGAISAECQVHSRRLIAIHDLHERAVRKVWREHDRFERQYLGEWRGHWRLFMQIIGTRAETLAGAMAQLDVIEREGVSSPFRHREDAHARIAKVMRNVRHLVAAQSAEV